jgi:hypothetical protein
VLRETCDGVTGRKRVNEGLMIREMYRAVEQDEQVNGIANVFLA